MAHSLKLDAASICHRRWYTYLKCFVQLDADVDTCGPHIGDRHVVVLSLPMCLWIITKLWGYRCWLMLTFRSSSEVRK